MKQQFWAYYFYSFQFIWGIQKKPASLLLFLFVRPLFSIVYCNFIVSLRYKDLSKDNIRKSVSTSHVLFLKFHLHLPSKYHFYLSNLTFNSRPSPFKKECKAFRHGSVLPWYIPLKGIKDSGSLYVAIGKISVSEKSFMKVAQMSLFHSYLVR